MFTESYLEVFLVVGIGLIIIDFFFQSDLLSYVGLGSISVGVSIFIAPPLLYQVLLSVVLWISLISLYYLFFRKITSRWANEKIAPNVIEVNPLDRHVGSETVVESVEGKQLIRLDGELVLFYSAKDVMEGDCVRIVAISNGHPTIERC